MIYNTTYNTTEDLRSVINFIRNKKITNFSVFVDLIINDDYMLGILIDYIDFFELYFEDLD